MKQWTSNDCNLHKKGIDYITNINDIVSLKSTKMENQIEKHKNNRHLHPMPIKGMLCNHYIYYSSSNIAKLQMIEAQGTGM